MQNRDPFESIKHSDPFLYGFIKGLQGAARPEPGKTTAQKTANTIEGQWRYVNKALSLPANTVVPPVKPTSAQ